MERINFRVSGFDNLGIQPFVKETKQIKGNIKILEVIIIIYSKLGI